MEPTFEFESALWQKGLRFVAGADEVGRGAFAGPVVAAAVVFDPLNTAWPENVFIRDSKVLAPKARECAAGWIKENTYWGIGEVAAATINRKGIGAATKMAFRRAVAELSYHLPKRLEHLLVDAFYVPYLVSVPKGRQTPIIKGDTLSCSIAAASIIAKCHRDSIMHTLGQKNTFKPYNWQNNSGYGTAEHRRVILTRGKTPQHRSAYLVKLFASPEQ